jgi:hypothetical protein
MENNIASELIAFITPCNAKNTLQLVLLIIHVYFIVYIIYLLPCVDSNNILYH